ncbi:MAG: winged helix-turn-helix domain-containing protein [Clostridiaceae bacterium]
MPFDVDNINRNLNIKVIFSKTVELIAALHMIADKRHHEFMPSWTKYVIDNLSDKSKETLEIVSGTNFPALELYDFILMDSVYEDVNTLLDKIIHCNELDFIYILLNGEVDKQDIKNLREDKNKLEDTMKKLSFAAGGSEKSLSSIIYATENYKCSLAALLKEIYSLGFEEELNKVQGLYSEAMDSIRTRLYDKDPIELAEEIKGSKLSARKTYKEYIFTPSYFLHHHNIVSYNEDRFMLVYNININNMDISADAERIADLLKVLSDKSRLEMLRQLKRRPTYGKVLASRLKLTTATISRHLDQLRTINLISEVKADKVKYFKVNADEVNKLLDEIKNFIDGR